MQKIEDDIAARSDMDVFLKFGKREISKHSLLKMFERTEWLNDELITYYFELLKHRQVVLLEHKQLHTRSLFFPTSFYSSLIGVGMDVSTSFCYERVSTFTKRLLKDETVLDYDNIFIPINVSNSHWICGFVDVRRKLVSVYDSKRNNVSMQEQNLTRFMAMEEGRLSLENGQSFGGNYSVESGKFDCVGPFQNNHYDCGLFVCLFADCLSIHQGLNFREEHMTVAKQRMIIAMKEGFPITLN